MATKSRAGAEACERRITTSFLTSCVCYRRRRGWTVEAPLESRKSRNPFWDFYRGLVWSNRDAIDAVWIRAALLQPRFGILLAIAGEFGLDRLRGEWAVLENDLEEEPQFRRARPAVERILVNIERGFRRRVVAAS